MTRGQVETRVDLSDAVDTILDAAYVRWYDSLPAGKPDQIEILDLALPAFLDAVPNFKALLAGCGWDRLQSMLRAASAQLQEIPHDVDLADWDDSEQARALLKSLFQSCTGGKNSGFPEFGPARATKLLHKKRPALLPIIDSWQLEAWGRRANPWTTDDMVDVVFNIKQQMVKSEGEFTQIQSRLAERDSSLPPLSVVRIYDILFWECSRGD